MTALAELLIGDSVVLLYSRTRSQNPTNITHHLVYAVIYAYILLRYDTRSNLLGE